MANLKEFAKLAFIKGVVKLLIPLVGVFLFKYLFNEVGYSQLFLISSFLSFCCFLYSFRFPPICSKDPAPIKLQTPAFSLFMTLIRKNYAQLLVFVLLICAYSVFVKFMPFVLFDLLEDNPSIVNYFASLVGLAYSLNQFFIVRYAELIGRRIFAVFAALCTISTLLPFITTGVLWFVGFFAVLFCFSVLTTCVEARLSLQGISSNQGTVQGILHSVENWGYILAPIIGSFIAGFSTIYPLYFVMVLAMLSSIVYNRSGTPQHSPIL